MAWTERQREAIESRGKNILVSAAAGSGKTAVLVQRIIDIIIRERVDVNSLLVVTFTKAAASEMKERIRSKLSQELMKDHSAEDTAYIRSQITALPNASIGTMHSFCVELIRRNFHQADIDPSVRIANESTLQILKSEALDAVLQEFYEEGDRTFFDLVDAYGGKRDDKDLRALLQDIYRFIQSQPEPVKWITDQAEAFNVQTEEEFEQTEWAKVMREDLLMKLNEMRIQLAQAREICDRVGGPKAYEAALISDDEMAEDLIKAAKESLQKYFEKVPLCVHERLKTINKKTMEKEEIREDWMNEVKELRQSAKDIIKEQQSIVGGESLGSQIRKLRLLYPMMKKLVQILKRFDACYASMKSEKGVLDFNDLEHYALRILEKEEVRESLRRKYTYIFFDEYQDSNLVQEQILSSICRKDNLFLVGDVKQSIYRFRLSDPTLFIRRYQTYKESRDPFGMKIDLSSNFRSRKSILDFANGLFGVLMSKELGEVDYDEEARLIAAAEFPPEPDHVEMVILENTKAENFREAFRGAEVSEEWEEMDQITLEAMYTAMRIRQLIGTKRYDPKSEQEKTVDYGDIVILMRSLTSKAEVFAKVLKEQNIPCYVEQSGSYFEVTEVRLFLDLLRLIDNPMQDEALLAVMNSSLFDFSAEELSKIRIFEKNHRTEKTKSETDFYTSMLGYGGHYDDLTADKIRVLTDKLEHYRLKNQLLRLEDFLWYILEDSALYQMVGAMPGGFERQKNLEAVVEKAVQYQSMNSGGLFGFLRYVEKILKDKTISSESKTFIQQNQVVRLMSIHKSKGLEFPIVFICNLGNGFNKMDNAQDIQLHNTLGLGPKYVNLKQSTYTDSIAKKVIKLKSNIQMLSEEMRILYVAITRAVDRLIMIGCVKDLSSTCINYCKNHSKTTLMKQQNFLAWIMIVLSKMPDASAVRAWADRETEDEMWQEDDDAVRFRLTLMQKSDLMKSLGRQEFLQEQKRHLPERFSEEDEDFARQLEERFAFRYPYYEDTIRRPKQSVTARIRQQSGEEAGREEIPMEVPRFMEGKREFGPMERGSILHFVMEVMDLHKADSLSDIERQIEEMTEKEILTYEEAKTVPVEKIHRLLNSSFGKRMTDSASIYREVHFLMRQDQEMIDGVIDCYFEEEDGLVLLDYKTDAVYGDVQKIKDRYEMQLRYYKQALEQSTGKIVKEVCLYLFDIDEVIYF